MSDLEFPVLGGWTMRRAGMADLEQIAQLERQIFVNDAWSPELWRQELASPHTWYLAVVPVDDPVVVRGYAGLLALPGSKDADVQTIALAPDVRGVGMGRELMNQLHAEAQRRGVRDVFLDVRVDNDRAQQLYHSLGYTDIGIRKGYYQPDDVDAIVMQLPLASNRPAAESTSGGGPAAESTSGGGPAAESAGGEPAAESAGGGTAVDSTAQPANGDQP
ncbi:ribosomal protein S18-alanine N-acetyltransferase [Gryllotalpicola ginsengisoli]|uniref:ribosomal protein S18-alanine N-acetyltransferase n=1 Tax=Gryllotalpicola ginsengisoli TaxID=444608 RepID=UPI000421CF4F|nr:ribosomal protein S18-alanine N-acetyltransferase [Gryllotalpicola ginsengisoli]